ncbi:MAG TPA: hypothetical protein VF174_07995 [Micromonosporaceae bacterium]
MSDYQIRTQQHYDLIRLLDAELRAVIAVVGEAVDDGQMTAEQALTRIRDRAARNQAAIDASWAELLGGGVS